MKKTRVDTAVFNPEKFLADEKKKLAKAEAEKFGRFSVFPIAFNKAFSRRLIERLVQEEPGVFVFTEGWRLDSPVVLRGAA